MGKRIPLIMSALAVFIVAGAAITGAAARPDGGIHPTNAASAKKVYKIALSNSFIGNQWRVEMENVFKAACAMPPYKTQVDCSVYNAGNDVTTQSQQISNLISQGVNAIVINAASTSGLNGVVGRPATAASWSSRSTTRSTAPCGCRSTPTRSQFGAAARAVHRRPAQGPGQRGHGHRRGRHGRRQRPQQGRRLGLRRNPGIKVVAALQRHVGLRDRAAGHRGAAAVPAEGRRRLGVRRHRRRGQGVRRREADADAGHRRRGRERLPQVHASAGVPRPAR